MVLGNSSGHANRRAEWVARTVERTGLDDATIELVVRTFYGKARKDPLLGPVFAEHVVQWEHHLRRMCEFWSSVALMSGRYSGRPMEKHLPLPIDARYFDRWLTLFEETAQKICPGAAADHLVERASWIAESLETGIATSNGVPLTKGQRYRLNEDDEPRG